MKRTKSSAFFLVLATVVLAQDCTSFLLSPSRISSNHRPKFASHSRNVVDKECVGKKRQRILNFLRNTPRKSKRFLAILGVSISIWRGPSIRPSTALASRTPTTMKTNDVDVSSETKKSGPDKGAVLIATGSAAVIAGVMVRKKASKIRSDGIDEDLTIGIPERPMLNRLKQTRSGNNKKKKKIMVDGEENEVTMLKLETLDLRDNSEMGSLTDQLDVSALEARDSRAEKVKALVDDGDILKATANDEKNFVARLEGPGSPSEIGLSQTSSPRIQIEEDIVVIEGGEEQSAEIVEGGDTQHLTEVEREWHRLMEDAVNTEYPLADRRFFEARIQPKSQEEEAAVSAKYAAIESVEDRAFQILLDLGLVEETKPIDIDMFNSTGPRFG